MQKMPPSERQTDMIIDLYDLPKISLNSIYSGKHWTKRKADKDNYTLIIKSQFKGVFSKDKTYNVHYTFFFKSRPLDTSNTVYMLKMVEDVIFEDDSYKIIPKLTIESLKGEKDFLRIKITEL